MNCSCGCSGQGSLGDSKCVPNSKGAPETRERPSRYFLMKAYFFEAL